VYNSDHRACFSTLLFYKNKRYQMNSPFANIFLSLQQHIKTELPEIRYIDQDLGQLNANTRPPVSWPCVLIDLENFDFENLGENVQTAKGTIVLRLGFAPHSNSSQISPQTNIRQAINYYDLEWSLHKTIQGWAPGDDMGSLVRTSATTQQRNDQYRVREIRYSIAFGDYSAKLQHAYAPATMVVHNEIRL
jgi:hypothetical protein